jgi:hypothetical protein
MALLSLKQENPRIHPNRSPLDAFGNLTLSQLDLFAISTEVDEVKRVVKYGLVLDGVVNLLMNSLVCLHYRNVQLILT